MSITNQQAFLNSINQSISGLVGGSQPDDEPGRSAWAWLATSGSAQPGEVNTWIAEQIASNSLTQDSYSPIKNWATWSIAMDMQFAYAPGSAKDWLGKTYAPDVAQDTVPPDVIDWTKNNLPKGLTVIVPRAPSAART